MDFVPNLLDNLSKYSIVYTEALIWGDLIFISMAALFEYTARKV